MFERLQERLETIFKKIRGVGRLSEENIKEAVREVRVALLEADVNYRVAKDFLARVTEKALGREVLSSVTPGQQFIKIVYDELCSLLGGERKDLSLFGPPPQPIMLVGLQGSGKTTTAGKLALLLRKKGRRPLLVATDTKRPAAKEQLLKIGAQIGIETYVSESQDPKTICEEARVFALKNGFDVLVVDTAGRLHVEDSLIEELREQKARLAPRETLLVVDAMTGQDAVNIASVFHEKVGVDGFILTKMDGDARGGAAISIKAITGRPIKFLGVGEKLDALEPFYPERIASRILGMGDVITLVEKAQELYDEKRQRELEKKLLKEEFTLVDFREQLRSLKRLGSLDSVLSMLPGFQRAKNVVDISNLEKELKKAEAIINSMTQKERMNPDIIDGSRRLRIARGSGTRVEDVNDLLRKYFEMKRLLKRIKKGGMRGIPNIFQGRL